MRHRLWVLLPCPGPPWPPPSDYTVRGVWLRWCTAPWAPPSSSSASSPNGDISPFFYTRSLGEYLVYWVPHSIYIVLQNTYTIPTAAPAPSSSSTFPTSDFTFSAGPTTTSSTTTLPSQTPFRSATAQTMFASRPSASAAHASTSTSTAHQSAQSQRGRSPLRGSTAAPHAFRSLAQSRHRDTVAAMGQPAEASSSKLFHPALSAQKEADLNPLRSRGQRKRKKRDDRSPSRERNVRGKPTPTSEPKAPPAKRTNYCFAALPFTKEVNRGNCTVPAAHELVYFEEGGYIKIITISSDDSPHDIQTKIAINYSHIQAFNDFGFRLLAVTRKVRRAKPGGKPLPKAGVARILRPIKHVPDHDALQIALSDSNIRKSRPRYRKVVFIALNPAGPNLPFHGVTYDPNDNLDHDLPSDYSESESSEDEATSSSEDENSDVTMEDDLHEEGGGNTDTKGKGKQKADDPKGKGKQKAEDSHFDTGFFDEDVAAGVEYDSDSGPHFERRSPGPDSGTVVPQTHLTMVRLLHNMQQPDVKASRRVNYWAGNEANSRGAFVSGNKAAELAARLLVQFIASPESSVLTGGQVLSFVESNICQPFLMLTKLGKRLAGQAEQTGTDELEADFDEAFAIGPAGLHGLAPHLQTAYMKLRCASGWTLIFYPKHSTWKSDEEFDDMTNTDSLASGWELDCSTTERDIRVRRADRRRRKGTKAKSPPIIISSDSESSTTTSSDSSSDSSSDGMFKKACNDWTRSRRRASASNNAKTNTNASSSNQSTTTSPNAEAASPSSSSFPDSRAANLA
ncbi:hypothetical protein R3P38DRAFT_3240760 [Favolaschia claudopus]|uniref:Uncharacterized protein n=1 Tax=Favolaschia claudopus TaxID=2862362 RepID=A0AAV9Z6L8_9AGAR